MANHELLQLAQDLEWVGCELGYGSQREIAVDVDTFAQKQEALSATADKIERELKDAIRFNPTSLVGVDFPLNVVLDGIGELLRAAEDIKFSALNDVRELPPKVRAFANQIRAFVAWAWPRAA